MGELERAFIGTIHSFCVTFSISAQWKLAWIRRFKSLPRPNVCLRESSAIGWMIDCGMTRPYCVDASRVSPGLKNDLSVAPIDKLRYEAWELAEWRDHDGIWPATHQSLRED